MTVRKWGGAHSTGLVALTLATKGTACTLCCADPTDPLAQGADSADHDPPRSELIRLGVPDPDDPRFLWPAHRWCNVARRARPITDALRAELRERRLHRLGLAPSVSAARLSPAIAARRPSSSPSPT